MPVDPPSRQESGQPLDQLTPEQLVSAYLAGRLEAFEELVHRFRGELFRFLVRFVGSKSAADDVFQETFLQVHQSAHTFDVSKRFKPWLFTIAANKARDYLRRQKRRRASSLSAPVGGQDSESASFVDLMEADVALPETVAQDAETAQRVREVVDALPDHLREVLVLAYFNQFAYKQIAEMLSIPLGTVKSRLHTAVGTFAKAWEKAERYNPQSSEEDV